MVRCGTDTKEFLSFSVTFSGGQNEEETFLFQVSFSRYPQY